MEQLNLQDEIQLTVLPTRTYQVKNGRILGWTTGMEAMKQTVEKLLLTERFQNLIYSEHYGVELNRLIGKSYDFTRRLEFRKGEIGCSVETLYRISVVLNTSIDKFFE